MTALVGLGRCCNPRVGERGQTECEPAATRCNQDGDDVEGDLVCAQMVGYGGQFNSAVVLSLSRAVGPNRVEQAADLS